MNKYCFYGEHSKKGLTLIELLIVISLMFIVGAAMMKASFPKEDDLRKQEPKEALENMIKIARKIANRDAKDIRIQFIDQGMNIKVGNQAGDHFDPKETNGDRKKFIVDFIQKTTNSMAISWETIPSSILTNTPLFIVTDSQGKAVFDENKVCYTMLRNPGSDPITGGMQKPFESGYMEKSETSTPFWKGNQGTNREYFTIYPSGFCDQVSFKAENCPEYKHNFVINPILGIVEKLN